MTAIQDIPHPAARLRSTIGATLATLGVLIAIGVGVLIITSVSSSRTVRTPSHATPCSEACPDGWYPRARLLRADQLPRSEPGEIGCPCFAR